MAITREAALKALNDAFAEGVKHLYGVMVDGLIDQQPAETAGRFKRGLANHCEAHARATQIVEAHFGVQS